MKCCEICGRPIKDKFDTCIACERKMKFVFDRLIASGFSYTKALAVVERNYPKRKPNSNSSQTTS